VELFPYQQQGACFLSYVQRGLLADEMGLGKSAQAIAACVELGARDRCVLVICPASLVENWKREFKKFSNLTPIVTSYNKADSLRTAVPAGDKWDVLILDEAHYLKTKDSKRTKAIFGEKCNGAEGLVADSKHVFLLTGTPIPNNPSELWPMLRAVMPDAIERPTKKGTIKPMAYWTFVERFCVTQDTGFGIKIIKGRNLAELKARIRPFVLRRKKGEVLKDLPPIRFDTLALDGAPIGDWKRVGLGTEDELKLIEKALADDGVAGLKAIAPHVAQLRRVTGMAKVPAAIEWIKEHFEGGGGKLVVFAHHTDVIEALDKALRDDVGTHVLHGGTPTHMRQAAVDAFQTNPDIRLFIGQIQAAGTGITLTAASDVLFVESSWVPAENEQAAMRVHRIGQKNACLIRFAMLAGSIDEQIQKAVMRKTQDIARLFS
jgi:SWI/SNF-related matrix-associated actin-dependent regulator 1 of chromatin subfamily A